MRICTILALFVAAVLSPCILETEIWGIGEVMVLDAVVFHDTLSGVFWAFESYEYHTLGPIPSTFKVLFPYFNPITFSVWVIGLLSPILASLTFTTKIGSRRAILVILLSGVLVAFISGLSSFRLELSYTYRRIPLFWPQVSSILAVLWYRRRHTPVVRSLD